MDSSRRQQLVRQRAVAKSCLTRMQTFIETGDRKLNDIQVRFEELPNIFNKFEAAQSELELSDDTDHSVENNNLKNNILRLRQSSMNSYTPWLIHHFLGTALHAAACQGTTITPHNHLLMA